MHEVMLDLETMGNSADSAIVAIGAVEFNTQTSELGRQFYVVVDLQTSVQAGGVMDASTVLWWLKQSDGARKLFSEKGKSINEALTDFATWLNQCGAVDDLKIWGNGAAFDNVILAGAYKRSGIQQPWQFRNDRCYRTIKGLYKEIKMRERVGVHHNALDDAISQALHLIDIFRVM